MASAHQRSCSPDWTNTDEVPSITRRAARSATPFVSDLRGVDLPWFQFSSSQAFINSRELEQFQWILGFLLDLRFFWDFSTSLELIWSWMDNFESIASPGLARPLQICDAMSIIENFVVCCDHITTFLNLNSVRPIVRISSAWRSCTFRVSADFAILDLEKMRK